MLGELRLILVQILCLWPLHGPSTCFYIDNILLASKLVSVQAKEDPSHNDETCKKESPIHV